MPHSPPVIFPASTVHQLSPCAIQPRSARQDAAERRRVTRRVRHALAAGDLLLQFQPLVALTSGQVRGAEALVRLRHHRLGLLPPSRFMPGAEETDIILEFGGWLLDQACAQAVAWPVAACVTVALALRQLQHRKFIQQLLERLGRTGIGPERLEFALTEAMLADATTNVTFNLKALQGLGIRLALTNFSTACANLPALRDLQFTTLKLGRSLTHGLDNGPASTALLRDAITAAHDLGCLVLADGIDPKRQFAKLLKLGCDEGQGNYLSPPLGAAEMTEQLTQS